VKIYWSPLALERLEQIFDYLAVDNKTAARKIVNKIFSRIESLLVNPQRGRNLPEINRKDIREVFSCGYRIIYKIEDNFIYVLTIRNFRQKITKNEIRNI
jgi:plasmid stabilization system protein ParE